MLANSFYFWREGSQVASSISFWFFWIVTTSIAYLGLPDEGAQGILRQMQITWDVARSKDLVGRLQPFLYLAPVVAYFLNFDNAHVTHQSSKFLRLLKVSSLVALLVVMELTLITWGVGSATVVLASTLLWLLLKSASTSKRKMATSTVFAAVCIVILVWIANGRRVLLSIGDEQHGFDKLRSIGTVDTVFLVIAIVFLLLILVQRTRLSSVLFCVWISYATFFHGLTHSADIRHLPAGFANQQGLGRNAPQNSVALVNWIQARSDLQAYADTNRFYPVFLVASEGGGAYAAAHSYLFLKSLERQFESLAQSQGVHFSEHIFALTGASGGAVGNAFYWSNTYGGAEQSDDCEEDIGIEFFQTDFLTPVVTSLLLEELPRRFAMLPQSLNGGRSDVLRRQFEAGGACVNGLTDINYFEHFWQHDSSKAATGSWSVSGDAALLPITTDAGNGQPYVFSPFEIAHPISGRSSEAGYYRDFRWGPINGTNRGVFVPNDDRDVSFSSAVTASAAFPYVSPSLALPLPPITPHYCVGDHHPACRFAVENPAEPPRPYGANIKNEDGALTGYRLLVDGGYSDNNGGNVLFSIEAALRNGTRVEVEPSEQSERFILPVDLNLCDVRLVSIPANYPNGQHAYPWVEDGRCSIPIAVTYIMIGAAWERPNVVPVDAWHQPARQQFLFDPLRTLLGVRTSVSIRSRNDFRHFVCPDEASSILNCEIGTQAQRARLASSLIDVTEHNLPLGWHLTAENLASLRAFGSVDDCSANQKTRACQSLFVLRTLLSP